MELVIKLCLVISSLNISADAKKTACDYMPQIVKQSQEEKIDPITILSMMYVESRFKKNAVSKSNACGLMQLIPKWNKERVNGKLIKYSCNELKEPERNIRLGIKALKRWLKVTRGNMDRSLCGYNAGTICIKKVKYPAKFGYVKAVRRMERKIKRSLSKL